MGARDAQQLAGRLDAGKELTDVRVWGVVGVVFLLLRYVEHSVLPKQ
jgi:hypothetical protein